MSILQDLEYRKYRYMFDLIKNPEQCDKTKTVITAPEAFKKCHKRYLLMEDVLSPLKKKLGEKVEVTDILFANGMQDDTGMIIKYIKEDHPYILTLSKNDDGEIDILSSQYVAQQEQFVLDNKKMILKTLDNVIDYSLNEDYSVKSTSGKFILKDNCDRFVIKDSEEKMLSIEGKHANYEKTGGLFDLSRLTCNYPKLKELLLENNNILAFYQHIQFYENDFPKQLIKKLTNR